jgi:regulator of protease activity HflC (stomatin/prohibitin superfamily)
MTEEKSISVLSGWLMLLVVIIFLPATIAMFIFGIMTIKSSGNPVYLILAIAMLIGFFLTVAGFFILNPNQAGVVVLFGNYKGTVKQNGFWWRNPFAGVKRISLRARNLNGDKLKVNDLNGNPIEVAAVVVWQVENTAEALFDVDDYEGYVHTQSEAAVRKLAGRYPYDTGVINELDNTEEISLRGGQDEINDQLLHELQERLGKAGVKVMEARISHLAYASEIAGAMLRRQQAKAIIEARKLIVEGAVTMVQMALDGLKERQVVELDEEKKAAMVSNLLVILCGEEGARPVVNTGTLYQ